MKKLLERENVLALLYKCYEILIGLNGVALTSSERAFITACTNIGTVFAEVADMEPVTTVQALGFHVDDSELVEDSAEDEEE